MKYVCKTKRSSTVQYWKTWLYNNVRSRIAASLVDVSMLSYAGMRRFLCICKADSNSNESYSEIRGVDTYIASS